MKSALVVAHPDDETLFFGGLVLAQPGEWDIICCSVPVADPVRAWKFFDAVKVLGGFPRLVFLPEAPGAPLGRNLDFLDLERYDRIVTHGVEGGYGHAAHIDLHHHIHKRWPHKQIWSDSPPGATNYDIGLMFDDETTGRKLKALQCYDHYLPYGGQMMTKWEALIQRYTIDGQWDLGIERYRIHRG